MMDTIKHRGPNSSGELVNEDTALGCRRLSIIDINSGMQPIYNEDKSKAVIFNGEIYNYQGIREELINKGHTFTTETDTEVLVALMLDLRTDFLLPCKLIAYELFLI